MKTVPISVPDAYSLPRFFQQASPEECAAALTFAAESFSVIRKKAQEDVQAKTYQEVYSKLLEEHQQNLEELRASSAADLRKVQESLRAARARIEANDNSAEDIRRKAQDEARHMAAELMKSKEDQITRLQGLLERQMESMCSRVETLHNSITRTFTSSKEKGAFAEWLIDGFLKKAYDCPVEVISKDSETADIRMTRPLAAYFWEVKNYTRYIETKEVEKFKRDLRLHPDVRGGVLVSLRTGISGKTRGGDIDLEFLEDGRPILYLSNLMNREDVVFYLQTLRPYFEALEALSQPAKDDSDTVRALISKAALVANLLRSHSQNVVKHRNSLVSHKKRTDAMFSEFQAFIAEAEAQLQTLLRVAVGSEEEQNEVQGDIDTALAPTVFRKETLSDCEDRLKLFVKWLLSVAEVAPGTQIEIKTLIERAKGSGFGEKYIRETREDLFQESAWARGSRHILGLTWKAVAP
jgi:hypothetical protein